MNTCVECLEPDDELVDGVCAPCREHFSAKDAEFESELVDSAGYHWPDDGDDFEEMDPFDDL